MKLHLNIFRYLPVQQDAETAINVKVFFKQVFTGQDSYQEQPVDVSYFLDQLVLVYYLCEFQLQ